MKMMMMRSQSRALENSKERKARVIVIVVVIARRADLYLLPSVFQVDHFLVRERHPSSSSLFFPLFFLSLFFFFFFFCRLSRLESFVFLSRLQVVLSRLKESFIIKKFFSLSFFDMMIFRQKKNKRILVIKTPKPTTTLTLTSYTLFGKEFKREHTTQALTTQTTQTTTQTTTDKGGGGAGEKRENVQGETRRRRRLRRQRGCNHHREKLTTARRRRTARGIPPRTQKSRWTKTKTKR